jgi:AraC-like DNA-binding protein
MADDKSVLLTFDSDALPERDRFPVFCEELVRRVIGSDVVKHGGAPFRAALDLRRAGAVGIANIRTTPVDVIREPKHARDGNDDIVVQLWRRGAGRIIQGRRESPVAACEGIILDNRNVGRLCESEPSDVWVLTIPRDKIVPLSPNIASFAASRIGAGPSLRLLFGYLEGTLALGLGNDQASQLFGSHLVELIALALNGDDAAQALQESKGVRGARLSAILGAISDQSADRSLSAAAVAAKLGVTARYVHLLLEQSGRTFTQLVMQRRLEKAAKLLADDKRQDRRIAEIAFEVGFTDLSHFNRAFRRHFGDTPTGVRASATLSDSRR